MDLINIIKDKLEHIEDGNYTSGLRAVLLHIETAASHFYRGQKTSENSAFTDTIYRTNQAFEGSLKEAYRVLAGKHPEKKSPYEIEKYLTTNNIFRYRVLSQLTNYRTEWRNPSTHDYKLDFDSSEAFLAVVSVCAFTNLLLDQIIEKLAHDRSKTSTDAEKENLAISFEKYKNDLPLFIGHVILKFIQMQSINDMKPSHHRGRMTEAEFIGALSGYLESVAPEINTINEYRIGVNGRDFGRGDMLISRGNEKLLVELKMTMSFSQSLLRACLHQLDAYMTSSQVPTAVLVLGYKTPIEISDMKNSKGQRILILTSQKILP